MCVSACVCVGVSVYLLVIISSFSRSLMANNSGQIVKFYQSRSKLNGNAENAVGWFRAYLSIWVAVIGISGNFIVLYVFSKERQRSRFSIYCMSLAVVHIVILFTNSFIDDFLGRGIIHISNYTYAGMKLDIKSNLLCKLIEYIPNAAYLASSWIVILFSCDRILTIFRPLKFMSIYYQSVAWVGSCGIMVVSFLLNICLLVIYERQVDLKHGVANTRMKCDISTQYNPTHFVMKYSLFLKIIGAFVIPNFLILVMNFIICLKLWRIQITRFKLLPSDSKNNNLEMSRVIGHLALSSSFILLTMPLVVVIILRIHSDKNNYKKVYPVYHDLLKHLSRLFSSMKDINYASDFFLCILFLPNFRWRFLRYACNICRHREWFQISRWGQVFEYNVHRFDSSVMKRKFATSTNQQHNFNIEMKSALLDRSLTPSLKQSNKM